MIYIYFFSVAENLLLRAARKNSSFQVVVSPYIELTHMSSAIQEINTLNTKIVFVSLNAERAIQLLWIVHERGLVWPEYAWIFTAFKLSISKLNSHLVTTLRLRLMGHFSLIFSHNQIQRLQNWFQGSHPQINIASTFQTSQRLSLSIMPLLLADQMDMLGCCMI